MVETDFPQLPWREDAALAQTLPSGGDEDSGDATPPPVSTSRLKRQAFEDWMEAPGPAIPSEDGKYQRQGIVGEGGMGVVLRVEDRDLRRVVAMKVLSRKNTSPEDMARFLRDFPAFQVTNSRGILNPKNSLHQK